MTMNHREPGVDPSRAGSQSQSGPASGGTSRLLIAVVVLQGVALAGVVGWLVGRGNAAGSIAAQHASHGPCPTDLPPRGVALVAGVRCSHGTPIVDAHCDDGHAMKRYILELINQGMNDGDISAALLRRYGEAVMHPASGALLRTSPGATTIPPSPGAAAPASALPGAGAAGLMGQRFPRLLLDRWVQGQEQLGRQAAGAIESFEGKVVLLDFMYPACPPCVRALPILSAIHAKHRAQGFAVVSLCPEWGVADLASLLTRLNVIHPAGVITGETERAYHLDMYPTYVLLDREGVIRWVNSASDPPADQIAKLLGEGPSAVAPTSVPSPAPRAPAPPGGVPSTPLSAEKLEITQVERLQRSFNPTAGEKVTIRFELSRSADVTVNIQGPNRELIATVLDKKGAPAGMNTVEWDGRDLTGRIVPDEAYFPRLLAIDGADTALWDPYLTSGGQRVTAGGLTTVAPGRFQYQLPEACRVLVRAAVEKGPLVRTIVNWQPRTSGLCVEDWDGMDADGLRQIAAIDNIRIGVMAFALPDKSIITSGNTALDYRSYYSETGKQRPHTEAVPRVKTGDALVSPHWEIPPHLNRDPGLTVEFVEAGNGGPGEPAPSEVGEKGRAESAVGSADAKATRLTKSARPVLVRVDVPEASEKEFLNNQRFELIVYVDDRRVIEVEQGHIPFAYPWDIAALSTGRHTLTINVSTFRNHVGTASRIVEVAE